MRRWHPDLVKLLLTVVFFAPHSFAGTSAGRGAAAKYFSQRAQSGQTPAKVSEEVKDPKLAKPPVEKEESTGVGEKRYLALHLGPFLSDQSWQWGGDGKRSNVGQFTAGVTYRMGEWVDSMDLLLRADFISYKLEGKRPLKLAILPVITFPDARSRFPLYFGAGAGAGIFLQQLPNESFLSLDYQIMAGIRFFNLINSMGFFVESGLKNHILLLSDGQFNGLFLAGGLVFTF